MPVRDPYFVYVDEAGDRGWGGASSPYFVITAVIVKASDDALLRSCLDQINKDLEKPPGFVLHWSKNIRDHTDRKHVARVLSDLPIMCVSVILDKRSLMGTGCGLSDHLRQYNYLVRRLLERVSWYVSQRHGVAKLYFGHVRRFKYETLRSYLDLLRGDPNCRITWSAVRDQYPVIEQQHKIRGLQVGDLVAGCLFAAMHEDRFGDIETAYLREVAPLFWIGTTRKLHTYGLHVVGNDGRCHRKFPWWDEVAELAGC